MFHYSITYQAATLADFLAAVESTQALGVRATIAPPPASVRPTTSAAPDKGEAYTRYCAGIVRENGAQGIKFFKRSPDEHARGLSLEQAALERMERPDWQSWQAHSSYRDTQAPAQAGQTGEQPSEIPPAPEWDGTPVY